MLQVQKTSVKPWFLHLNPNTVVVLYSGWRRESKHAEVKVKAWKVTLPLRGEQSLDKERDIEGIKNDARVLNSGIAQAQPIKKRGIS